MSAERALLALTAQRGTDLGLTVGRLKEKDAIILNFLLEPVLGFLLDCV